MEFFLFVWLGSFKLVFFVFYAYAAGLVFGMAPFFLVRVWFRLEHLGRPRIAEVAASEQVRFLSCLFYVYSFRLTYFGFVKIGLGLDISDGPLTISKLFGLVWLLWVRLASRSVLLCCAFVLCFFSFVGGGR